MKELLENLKRIDLDKAKGLILLDTCFIISMLDHNSHIPLNSATTSFNIEELMHVEHRLNHELRKKLRNFLKHENLIIVDINVHPGDWVTEKSFVNSVDSELLMHIPDASDAVLLAAAVKTKSIVLTKDKHHLFTVELENFLNKYDLKVFKELKDLN
ncbi:MAG: PIN domain-containing protein [Nanoarchaeota archaeon]|nr:PIN domain-containing protein [Nanoarchaeota archaeon]MCG2720188.1 PIN domain-containing protein [Nanoarchaeota archaeon]